MADTTEIAGTVWGVFAHRLALESAAGKVLADLGPGAHVSSLVREGDRIIVRGDRKPSEIKAREIVTADGSVHSVSWPDKHDSPPDDPTALLEAVRRAGYEVTGEPHRKPKHWEIRATHDGRPVELHVELDGSIRKVKDANAS